MINDNHDKILPIKIDKSLDKNNEIKSQGENILIEYTDSHFMNQLNINMEPFTRRPNELNEKNLEQLSSTPLHKLNRGSNSPITLSNSSSETNLLEKQESDEITERNLLKVSNIFFGTSDNEHDSNLTTSDVTKSIRQIALNNRSDESTDNKRDSNLTTSDEPTNVRTTIGVSDINISEYSEGDTERNDNAQKLKRFRKLTYKEVEKSLNEYTSENKNSNELEIIITYLNGQKNLYIHSKNFTQCKLNALMIPTLFISTVVTVISPFVCSSTWSDMYIVVLNAIITLLISLVNYYKLESTYQIYGHIACQYDKLQTVLEMANSRLMFLDNEIDQNHLVIEKLKEFEEKIFEIKDATTIFIPDDIKNVFPIISHINIFSFIKRIETYKKSLTLKYCDVKNEMRYIIFKCETRNNDDERLRNRLTFLIDIKDKIRDEIIDYKNAYSYMDDAFIREIKCAEEHKFWCIHRMLGTRVVNNQSNHPIVVKHIPNL